MRLRILLSMSFGILIGTCLQTSFAFLMAGPPAVNSKEDVGKPLSDLRVLFVGSERQADFVEFLQAHLKKIEAVGRGDFEPKRAANFDVVILDWPQSGRAEDMSKITSPLGAREQWDRPTVLLGSAGLHLAVAWQMQGGSGCTCMDPVAYGFREHEIFEHPYKIQMASIIKIKTPEAFEREIADKSIPVLPLVDDREKDWHPGWCTYATYFDKNPDVEYLCGGVNHKTPTAAGIWRQGNLLHFGFEPSPREMNAHGQQLLLNAIAYIQRFSQDRPIARTPSVFAGPVAPPRLKPERWLDREDIPAQWVLDLFEPNARSIIEGKDSKSKQKAWCSENSKFFYPKQNHLLGIDEDLRFLNVGFDTPEFFDRVLNGLESSTSEESERSRRLLDRYVSIGPGQQASPQEWKDWYRSNRPYLFALDTGDYCWYIDPLAKCRQIPSIELRGPLRADIE